MRMKISLVVCALLALCRQAVSLLPEIKLYDYALQKFRIREIIHGISEFTLDTDDRIEQLAESFHANVTDLWSTFGSRVAEDFRREYRRKRAKFAADPVLRRKCPESVDRLLEQNQNHQQQLANFQLTAVDNWRIAYEGYSNKADSSKTAFSDLEQKSVDCGGFLLRNDSAALDTCINNVLKEVEEADNQTRNEISRELTKLTETQQQQLVILHQSVQRVSIPEFYSTFKRGETADWFRMDCPENP